jgi:hypothetical protein
MATSNKQWVLTALIVVLSLVATGATRPAATDQPVASGSGAGASPTECRPLLQGMLPCAAFLSEAGVYAPDQACCDGFNAMFGYETVTCACHVVNGDIGQILPAPIRPARIVELFAVCGRQNVPVDRFAAFCRASKSSHASFCVFCICFWLPPDSLNSCSAAD